MPSLPEPSPALTVQIDGQTAASWSTVLAGFEDANLYQTWGYGAVRWGEAALSHVVLRRDGQVVAAAQVRLVRVPFLPVGLAFLRWGPLIRQKNHPDNPTLLPAMLGHLREEYCIRRGLTLRVIPQAFDDSPAATAYTSALTEAGLRYDPPGSLYRTVLVDLAQPEATLREGFSQRSRRNLKKAEKHTLETSESTDAAAYREFLALYEPMRRRKQFDSAVDVEEFGRIQDRLPPAEKARIFVAKQAGVPLAALVCSPLGDTMNYLLGASNEQALEVRASYLLHWQAMLWAKARGLRWYDLGGIDPAGNPGGYEFKTGFGGREVRQLAPHSLAGGMLNRLLLGLVNWRRQRQAPKAKARNAPV